MGAHTKHWANKLPLTSVLNSGEIQFSPTSAAANSMHQLIFKLYLNIACIQWHYSKSLFNATTIQNTVYMAVWLRSENKTRISIIHKTAYCLQLRIFQLISRTHNIQHDDFLLQTYVAYNFISVNNKLTNGKWDDHISKLQTTDHLLTNRHI